MLRKTVLLLLVLYCPLLLSCHKVSYCGQEGSFKSIFFTPAFRYVSGIAVKGNHAYLVGRQGMAVLDISYPSSPKMIKILRSKDPFNDIVIIGNLAYVTCGERWHPNGTLKIFNISDPRTAKEIPNNLVLPDGPIGLVVQGNIAYIGDYTSGLILVDISDPAKPKILSSFYIPQEVSQEQYQRMLTFVKSDPKGFLKMVNDKYPNIGVTPGKIDRLIKDVGLEYFVRNIAYIIEHGNQAHVWWPAVRYPYAFVPYDGGGFYILDISDPSNPVKMSSFDKKGPKGEYFFNSVAVSGDYVFIAIDYGGLLVLDISDVKKPREVAHVDPWSDYGWLYSPGHTIKIVIKGDIAYVTTGEDGLYLYDVSNPRSPRLIRKIDKSVPLGKGLAWGLFVQDPLVIVGYINECDTGVCKNKFLTGGFEIFMRSKGNH